MKFQHTPPSSPRPGPTDRFAPADKRRLAFLIGGFVVTASVLVTTLNQASREGGAPKAVPIADETRIEEPVLSVPELDRARLETLVHDATPEDRVVLEGEAADLVLDAARRYTPRHYASLHAPELDAGGVAALLADPKASRGKPFTARGHIVSLRARTGAAHEEQFLGRLELQDGATVHFLVLSVPEHAAEIGGFVRIDGLFLKAYATEDALDAGTWLAGPLLVGAKAERSYADLGTVTRLDHSLFDDVPDADLAPDPGQEPRLVPETPAEPFWQLMAYARDLPADAIDWEKVPVLDQRLLDQLLEDPADFRAEPVRIPISRLQDGRVCLAGENPARMQRYMQGWIGNTTWKNVIQFRTPVLRPELLIGDLVYGRGFFLHDFSYQSAERGLRVAPVFVLQSLERHVVVPSKVLNRIPWAIAALGAVLLALFVVLTRRDRRRSSEFHEQIVRRRRERRARKGSVGTAAP